MRDKSTKAADRVPGQTLITVPELAVGLADPDWRVLDCRFDLFDPAAGRRAWQRGHLPGALYADLERDLSAPATGPGGRHPLPAPASLVAQLGRWGIEAGTQVVAYDDCGGLIAGRAWWLLRWLGHERVAVLDGGLAAWQAAGLPLSTAQTEPPAVRYRPRAPQGGAMPVLDAEELARRLAEDRLLLVDVRSPERYQGREEPIDPRAGHVPGALNLPLAGNLDGDGRFLPAATLRERYAPLLARASGRALAVMCGSGVSACQALIAMELAGLPAPMLYAGSWSDWISDPSRPVACGDA